MNVNLKENIRVGAPLLSVLSFWWLKDLFSIGAKRQITLDDLYSPLPEDRSEVLTNRLERNWQQELNGNSERPSLVRAIFRTFRREYIAMGLVTVFNDFVVRLISPLLLHQVLRYFRHDSDVSFSVASYSATGIVLLSFCGVLSYNHITYMATHNGGKLRTAVCGLVYRKTLRLSKASPYQQCSEISPGHVINLMSNDLSRFDMASAFLNWIWAGPLLVLTIAWILYERVGWPPLIGIGIILVVVPLQCYLGKLGAIMQRRAATETDERLSLVAELVAGIQMIKVYAWESWIRSRIRRVRDKELRMILSSEYFRGVYMSLVLFVPRLIICATLLVMVGDDSREFLTTANVFMITAYYNIIGHATGQMFVRGVTELTAVNVSIKRLETYLKSPEVSMSPEMKDYKARLDNPTAATEQTATMPSIRIEDGNAFWNRRIKLIDSKTMLLYKSNPPTLNNVNLLLEGSDKLLVGIVGPVGCGKTSLLQLIMGELPLANGYGRVVASGKISYSPQEAWICNGSIRENIIFDEPWDESRYRSVLDKCALLDDLKELPQGDHTITGERGTSLSGGQKARVGLARAIYRRADIYLLDDPLSAVDSQVGRFLFDDIIGRTGFLSGGDSMAMRLLVTHQLDYLRHMDWIVVMNDGCIQVQGRPEDILNEGLVDLAQYESKSAKRRESVPSKDDDDADSESDSTKFPEFELESVVVPAKSKTYLRKGGGSTVIVLILSLFAVTQIACSMTDAFVAYWMRWENGRGNKSISESLTGSATMGMATVEGEEAANSRDTYVLIGGLLLIAIMCLTIVRTFVFSQSSIRAAGKIHDEMLDGLLQTPLHFFETSPSGRILNKFSRDLGVTDVALPKLIMDALQMVSMICGATLVVVIVNPIFLIPLLLLIELFRRARSIYLKSSRHLKRLESITKSPIFTLVASTLRGLSVIRSTGAQRRMVQQFDKLQDLNTASWYLFQATTVAYCQLLDLYAVLFTAVILIYFLACPSVIEEERIGLAITQAMMISGLLSRGMRQTAAASNALVSAERVLEYVSLPKETSDEYRNSGELKDWPQTGQIEFVNVNYRYGGGKQNVLSDVNLLIKSRQKVGVVGRTGAGKSSLVSALFRLAEFVDGAILIDGLNTEDIPLRLLRQRISIIPQDPFLFRGTIKTNLDPFEDYSEAEIRQALADVDMHLACNHPVQESGSNFSVGERQLICLARAILRNNKILILDEATANVDPTTDKLIQETIRRRRFEDCTVIAIAHRIHTVADYDMIIVVDQGRICDYGPPSVILPKAKLQNFPIS